MCDWSREKENSAALLHPSLITPKSRRGDGREVDSDRACWLGLMRFELTAPPRAGVCRTSLPGNSSNSGEERSVCSTLTCSMRDFKEDFLEQRAAQHAGTICHHSESCTLLTSTGSSYLLSKYTVCLFVFFLQILYSVRGRVQDIPTWSTRVSSNL